MRRLAHLIGSLGAKKRTGADDPCLFFPVSSVSGCEGCMGRPVTKEIKKEWKLKKRKKEKGNYGEDKAEWLDTWFN